MGEWLLGACSELWLCGGRVSGGMHEELEAALRLGIPVRHVPWRAVAEFMRQPAEEKVGGSP